MNAGQQDLQKIKEGNGPKRRIGPTDGHLPLSSHQEKKTHTKYKD